MMNSSLKIDLNRVKQIVVETIRTNESTTMDLLLVALKSNYPNVNTVHLRYKLSKGILELKKENAVREIENIKIDFGRNVHHWDRHVRSIDLNIIQCLKTIDQLLEEICI